MNKKCIQISGLSLSDMDGRISSVIPLLLIVYSTMD